MKILHLDPLGGASGDMFLAALIDLGAPLDKLFVELKKLNLSQEFKIEVLQKVNRGFEGKQVNVILNHNCEWVSPESLLAHEHSPRRDHSHHHNDYASIRKMLEKSELPERAREMALKVFYNLALAEGKVHGKPPEEVHFHEVGAVDSIVDIVGTCLAIDLLDIQKITSSAIGVASGRVNCAHGMLPLPAPATAWLLKGIPSYQTGEEKELCTPTGAALLSSLASFAPDQSVKVLENIGIGLSHRTTKSVPPFLRATIYNSDSNASSFEKDMIQKLSCDLDDMPPEYLTHLRSLLEEAGALDVSLVTLQMKKNRPGIELRILCREESADALIAILMNDSTTFGVRREWIMRETLPRKMEQLKTPWGEVAVKVARWDGQEKRHVEFEDVAKLCKGHKLSWRQVMDWISAQH